MKGSARTRARPVWAAWLGGWALAAGLQAPAGAQPAGPAPAAGNEATVRVQAFRIEGNTLLDAALLQATLQPWLGQRTLAELRQAAQAVQALYGRAGYGAVVAYLPPQPVADGQVGIVVVEGRIGRILVQGHQRLTPERVRAALPSLVPGRTPPLRRIDAELQMANENPSRSIGVLLAPGGVPGEVEATVKVQEQPLQRWSLALDNSGNPRTGQYRLGLGWQHADITQHDDVLSLQLQTSPTESSALRVFSAAYRLPLLPALAALELFAAYSDIDGGLQASAAGDLRFAGKGRIVGARAIAYLPRWGEFDQRLISTLELRQYRNQCDVAGLPSGACGGAGESVSLHPLTLEYAAQSAGPVAAALNIALAYNLALGGRHGDAAAFEAVRSGARRRYALLRASGQISLPVWEDWRLAGRLALQHSSHPLVPGEQFGLGGAASVRGYQERELAADSGLSAALELTTPRLGGALLGPASDARLLAFADAGQVANQGDLDCREQQRRCTLSSFGLGAQLGWNTLQWRLAVAQAQQDGISTRRKGWRTHFALGASF